MFRRRISSASATASAGLSNARETWGPAVTHPLILGPNAPGFAHAFVGTGHPVPITLELLMAVALGEGDVKTIEDLAGLVPDDMRGWFESKGGERVREPGILESFNLSPDDAEALIMRARIAMGWVEAPPEPEYEEAEEAEVAEAEGEEAPAAEEAAEEQ